MSNRIKQILALLVVIVAVAVVWQAAPWRSDEKADAFVSGNGRIEATEIAVASKLAGRLQEVLVREGEFVKAGQPLARLQAEGLQAQRDEASARLQQAMQAISMAQAQVAQAQSNHQSALAVVVQRETDLSSAQRRLPRVEKLAREGFYSDQTLDDERAKVRTLGAALSAARAQARAAEAGIGAARTQVAAAEANLSAMQATLQRIDVELADSVLKAPRDGRVQFLIAHPGEIVAGGGRVLNLLDLSDVYMTFFLPETVAGRVALGAEVRIVLDAAPQYVIPARVSFVASAAQFTPKTVETASERQKLMFRVRAQVDRALLLKHIEQVKTGLPGVAWLRLDESATWPAPLAQVLAP
ncbi:MAG: HlyD family efflux transporter periplasmic adaptor subunit [Burkholderiaceae bacterium]